MPRCIPDCFALGIPWVELTAGACSTRRVRNRDAKRERNWSPVSEVASYSCRLGKLASITSSKMPRIDYICVRKMLLQQRPVLLREQFLSCLRAPGRPGLCNLLLAIHGMSYSLSIRTWKNEVRSANGENLREKRQRSGQDIEASSLGAFQAQAPGARLLRCNKSSEHCRFGGLDRPWILVAAAFPASACVRPNPTWASQLQLPGSGVRARLQASLK